MNTQKVIGGRRLSFAIAPSWICQVILAAAVLLIGAGDARAQSTSKDAAPANKTPPALSAEEIGEARRRFAEPGYWVKGEGAADEASLRHALIAFQKIEGRPLGLLYYPNYIQGGVAIHGNPSVPPLPASHGCIRIPMFAAQEFSELAIIGGMVLIYDNSSFPPGTLKP